MTFEERNALECAKRYLRNSSFSRKKLIHQLEYEKYPYEAAVFAADNVSADWSEQAVKMAKAYLNNMPFSRQKLFDQLVHEGFTDDQAEYAVIAATGGSPFDISEYVTVEETVIDDNQIETHRTYQLPTKEQEKNFFCTNCGTGINQTAGCFCQYCGARLPEEWIKLHS